MDASAENMFLSKLREIVGINNVLTEKSDLSGYVIDARRRYEGNTMAVVRPATTQEVSEIVALCSQEKVAVIPQGGNTGMCGGATPLLKDRASIIVALGRMNQVRHLDPANNTIAVDAGCTLSSIQAGATAVERLFPMSLGSEGTCQIGGNIATNAGGTSVLRYGPMRDLVLGIEAVLPDGRIVDAMKGLRKDNTGFALKHLFIGSEGTIGIITGAVLKLVAKPAKSSVAMVGLADIDKVLDLLHKVQMAVGDRLTNFEVLSSGQYELVMDLPKGLQNPLADQHAWITVIELTDPDPKADLDELMASILYEAMETKIVDEAILANSDAKAELIWEIRHSVTEANVNAGLTFSHDTSVPVSRVPHFVNDVQKLIGERFPEAKVVFVGHVGDGNIHAVVILPRELKTDKAAVDALAAAVNATIDEVAIALAGSISAEHGIGRSNRARLHSYLDETQLTLMRGIKSVFDPEGIMNPNVLF
jgi:FAD/FMN-containing dehydrogenase